MTEEIKDTPEVLLDKLRAANAEAKKFREERDAAVGRVTELESDESLSKMQKRVVTTEAKNRLMAEGVKDPERILKYLKAENVKVTDDGLDGLDEVLKEVKTDFPELFDAKRRVGGGADGAEKTAPAVKKTVTELQADRILGRTS
jgi:poly-D-alanine transfer protein DltD